METSHAPYSTIHELLFGLHYEAHKEPCTASARPARQDLQVSIPSQEAQYPPRLLLNRTGSEGWAPGLSQHRARSTWVTFKQGKPDVISQTLLTRTTEDRPEGILFLP